MGKKRYMKDAEEINKLRNFAKSFLNLKLENVDEEFGDVIDRSNSTIESVAGGTRQLSTDEARKIAERLFCLTKEKNCSKHIFEILNKLLRDFLSYYESESYLTKIFDEEKIEEDSTSKSATKYHYSNLPSCGDKKVIREYLLDEIKEKIEKNAIVFMSGIPGTGKSFIANVVAHKYYGCDEYSVAIWIECQNRNLIFDDFIMSILSAFDVENACTLSSDEKVKCAQIYLLHNKAIIVIDNIDSVTNVLEQTKIFSFFSEKISNDTIVIITSKLKINGYKNIINTYRFLEVQIGEFKLPEWRQLFDIYSQSRDDIRNAEKLLPDLPEKIYKIGKGNPYVMTQVLFSVIEKILMGSDFTKIENNYLSDLDNKSYKKILNESIIDLPDDCIRLLVTLSLFVIPESADLLNKISGIEAVDKNGFTVLGSDLALSILKCYNYRLLDQDVSDGRVKYSLQEMIRPIINSKLKNEPKKYQAIIERWIQHYTELVLKIGFCFNDFKRLEELDDGSNHEIDNIVYLLEYCEREKRWSDFYTISENTKYFFYTRGISGNGKDSIHYRRAIAARHCQNYVAEFDSLLYYCNVSCKSKVWTDVDECFVRIEELKNTIKDIPRTSILKYCYTRALYYFFSDRADEDKAIKLFKSYEEDIKKTLYQHGRDNINMLISQYNPQEIDMFIHDYVASLRWHCECIYSLLSKNPEKFDGVDIISEVDNLIDESMELASKVNFERAIVHNQLIRIKFRIFLNHDSEKIPELFNFLNSYTQIINDDAMYQNEYKALNEKYRELIGGTGR